MQRGTHAVGKSIHGDQARWEVEAAREARDAKPCANLHASGLKSYAIDCIFFLENTNPASGTLVAVHKIGLSYSLETSAAAPLIRNPLIDLLQAVRASGSISGAAKTLNLSYRHVWGELKRWEQVLDHPLVIWEKGTPARLSPFGDKLLWSERQAQARLAPQIEALRAELTDSLDSPFDADQS